ncbi:unnamed protein product, partial [Rotaria sp. Silwood2]
HGELWKLLLGLQDHTPQFTFQSSINDLSIYLRAKIVSLSLPNIFCGRTTTTGQHLTSLALDPIEYFLFHLLSYVVSYQQSLINFKKSILLNFMTIVHFRIKWPWAFFQ